MDNCKAFSLSTFLLITLNLVSFVGFGQSSLNDETVAVKTIDRTYALYLKSDWKALIANGDSILKGGSDYYYLRLRLGIAYFEASEYLLAEEQFKRAVEFNSLENLPKEYLYYCYLNTGRIVQARRLAKGFNQDLIKKIGLDSIPVFNYVGLDGGGKFSDLTNVPNASLVGFNLGHRLNPTVFIDHSYSYYSQSNSLWSFKQHDYFLQANIALKDDYTIAGGFHYVHSTLLYSSVSTSSNTNWFVSSFNLEKQFKKHKAEFGLSTIGSSGYFQLQYNLGYAFYPKANNDLFFGAKAYIHTNDGHVSTNLAALPFVSYKPYEKWNIFGSYLFNGGSNIAEWNGALMNNSPDLTTGRFSATINYQVLKKTTIGLTYQYEQKESSWTSNHTYNSLFVSLKYNSL